MAQDKPNIVFILMYNLGYGEVGCYGGGLVRGAATPRIDRLAREGMKLLNFNGVDQGDFFRGKTDRSAREGFPIFFGEKLYGAKWRDFKMLLVEQSAFDAPASALSVPRIYDLYTNPQEVLELNIATTHLWVLHPIYKMIGEYQTSMKQHPPIPVGIPDPYVPPGGSA